MNGHKFKGNRRKGRKSRKLPPKPIFLITCEGKTEKVYFDEIRIKKRIVKDRIKIFDSVGCKGTDPLNLVSCAKAKRRELKQTTGIDYDQVWCVFDCDDHNNINAAMNKAKANNVSIAFSNPCFEIWPLIHFKEQMAYIRRDHVLRELKRNGYLPNYNKGDNGLFGILEDRLPVAIGRAKAQRDFHKNNQRNTTENPSTNIDEIVALLMEL